MLETNRAAMNSNFSLDSNSSSTDFKILDIASQRFFSTYGTLSTLGVFCFVLVATLKYESGRRSQKTSIKGIPYLSFIDIILYLPGFLVSPETNLIPSLYEYTLKYGSLFKGFFLGLSFTIVNSPELIQKVLVSHNPGHLNKPKAIYQYAFGPFHNSLVSSDVDIWTPHRKIVSRSFTYQAFQRYFPKINFYTRQMLDTISKKVDKEESFTFSALMSHTVAKSVLYLIIGPHNCTEEEVSIINEAIQMGKDISSYRLLRPWLLIKPFWWLHPLAWKRAYYISRFQQFASEIIKRFREKFNTTEAMFVKPSCMIEEMLVKGMSDDEIMDEFAILIAAGTETTSLSINYFLFLLALHPEHLELCRKEVDSVFDAKSSGSSDLTMGDLCSFKHLKRCMLEAQRMVSTIPILVRRMDQPLKLDTNLTLKTGDWVCISPWAQHKNPKYYPNPEKFDPDRFLPENCKARHPYAFIPFSAGPRNCIGWKLANIQTKVVIAWILRKFEIHTSDRLEDIRFKFSVSLASEREINLSFKKRLES